MNDERGKLTAFLSTVDESLPRELRVAVDHRAIDKLQGVRDGFIRYFLEGPPQRPVEVLVESSSEADDPHRLPLSSSATASLALERARALSERLADGYQFFVVCEGGLESVEVLGDIRCFTQTWTAICAGGREALGASSVIEVPTDLMHDQPPTRGGRSLGPLPGTRRGGGMASALTGGLENQRHAVAKATTNALATLLYGRFSSGPHR